MILSRKGGHDPFFHIQLSVLGVPRKERKENPLPPASFDWLWEGSHTGVQVGHYRHPQLLQAQL